MPLNRRIIAGALIAATAGIGVATSGAADAAPNRTPVVVDVQGAPTPVIDLNVKARNQSAKVTWKAPFMGGTVDHYEARLLTLDGVLVSEVETTKPTAKLVRPRDLDSGWSNLFLVHVVAVGNDGTARAPIWMESPLQWRYAELRYKK